LNFADFSGINPPIGMRILSLDGGGTWAVLQAMALGNLYGDDTGGRQILAQFDFVSATSGGSIVLGCLLNDWSPSKIAKFFLDEQQRKNIFVARGWGILRPGLARWSTAGKFAGLKKLLGEELLSDLAAKVPRATKLQIVITAYDYDRNRARFFRSNPNSASASNVISQPVTIAQAVHASSNAPVIYFDEPADLGSIGRFWDGGLTSFDNPVLAGLNEAIANGADAKEISVLSLGAANSVLPLRGSFPAEADVLVRDLPDTHIWTEMKTVMTSILADPPDEATFTAFLMMQHELDTPPNQLRHVRLNPLIQPVLRNGRWEFPNGFRENKISLAPEIMFERLAKLDMDVVEDDDVKLIYELGRLWTGGAEIPNQPVRPDDHLAPQIGFGNFADAKARWQQL
jgi:uncharacterized protein